MATVNAGVVSQASHENSYHHDNKTTQRINNNTIQHSTQHVPPQQDTRYTPHNTTSRPVHRHNNQHTTTHYSPRPPMHRNHTPQRHNTAPRQNKTTPAVTRWVPSPEQCFNCTRYGHTASTCQFPPSCLYHHTVARHNWADCLTFPEQVRITYDLLKQRKHKRPFFFGIGETHTDIGDLQDGFYDYHSQRPT